MRSRLQLGCVACQEIWEAVDFKEMLNSSTKDFFCWGGSAKPRGGHSVLVCFPPERVAISDRESYCCNSPIWHFVHLVRGGHEFGSMREKRLPRNPPRTSQHSCRVRVVSLFSRARLIRRWLDEAAPIFPAEKHPDCIVSHPSGALMRSAVTSSPCAAE